MELYYSPVSYNLCKPQLISAQPLKDGSKLNGTIIEMDPSLQLRLRTSDGSEHVIQMADVDRIAKERHPSAPADLMDAAYREIGVTFGTPAAINFQVGSAYPKWIARVAGGYLPGAESGEKFWGIQATIGKKLGDTQRTRT